MHKVVTQMEMSGGGMMFYNVCQKSKMKKSDVSGSRWCVVHYTKELTKNSNLGEL